MIGSFTHSRPGVAAPAAPRTLRHVGAVLLAAVSALLVTMPHPTIADGVRMTGIPVKLRGTPAGLRRHPPLAGEHTREILREHGYADAQVAALERSGVVRSWGAPAAVAP